MMMTAPDLAQGSPDRFGYSWQKFHNLSDGQEEQFRRWTAAIDPETGWRGKLFLDGGCGAGRNSVWPMKYGAAGGLAIDVDDRSLGAARENLAPWPSVTVAHRSLYAIGETDRFDVAFSIGVIHHLADPEAAVRELTKAVKPGGRVIVWLYGRENMEMYLRIMDPLRKTLFSRLPLGVVRALAHVPSAVLWLLLRCGYRPIEYYRLLRNFPYAHLHHIAFDQMLPRVALYYRREEALALLAQAGLENVRAEWVNEMSWSVSGTKPAAPRAGAA